MALRGKAKEFDNVKPLNGMVVSETAEKTHKTFV